MHGQAQSQIIRYHSKVDTWLVAILSGAFLISLIVILSTLVIPGAFVAGGWMGLILDLGVWGLVFSLLFPLYYEITPSTLLVRSGWIRKEIPLASIQ